MASGFQRIVQANRIISPKLPSAQISVNPAFSYVGGPRLQLYSTDKRNELMIIYGESSGEAEHAPNTSAFERALASFSVQFLLEINDSTQCIG
jgi:hypothetical protein